LRWSHLGQILHSYISLQKRINHTALHIRRKHALDISEKISRVTIRLKKKINKLAPERADFAFAAAIPLLPHAHTPVQDRSIALSVNCCF